MTAEILINAISALGTIGAVVVALYLSRKTENLREAKEVRLQRMHSLYLLPVLERLWADLFASSLETFVYDAPNSMGDVAVRLDRAKKWAVDFESHLTLAPLSAESLLMLPEITGHRISRALGILHALRIEILRFNPDDCCGNFHDAEMQADKWMEVQGTVKDLIFATLQELHSKAIPEAISPARSSFMEKATNS